MDFGQQPVEEVDDDLADGNAEEDCQNDADGVDDEMGGGEGDESRDGGRSQEDDGDIAMGAGVPPLGREEQPAQMLVLLVGLRHK